LKRRIFAISDLHLPGDTGKGMEIFGGHWRDHPARIAADWDARVRAGDLVLLPGDLSWAMRLAGARDDLAWLGARPGRKLLVRGNHDYWWQSIGKVRAALPPGCHAIQNDAWYDAETGIAVGGSRLWDVPGLSFGDIFEVEGLLEGEPGGTPPPDPAETERIFLREMGRLEASLRALPSAATFRIALLHYPPTNPGLEATPVTDLLERHGVDLCLFGHLHALREPVPFDGVRGGVRYVLVSADHVAFRLVELLRPGSGTRCSVVRSPVE